MIEENYFDFTLTCDVAEEFDLNENNNRTAEINVVTDELEHAIIALRNLREPGEIDDMPAIVALLFEKSAEAFQTETDLSIEVNNVEFTQFVDNDKKWRKETLKLFVEEAETKETYNVELTFYAPGYVEMMEIFNLVTTDENLEKVLEEFIQ